MATRGQPWHCAWCQKDVKGTFSNCGFCGSHWTECCPQTPRSPRSTKSPRRRQGSTWTYSGHWGQQDGGSYYQGPWNGPSSTPKSPRRVPKKSPARPQKKNDNKQGKARIVPPAEPEWGGSQDHAPDSTAAASKPSAAEMQLKELASAVKQMDQPLTTDVQRALANAQKLVVVDPTIQLQSAAAKLGHARDQLLLARKARQNLHNSWAKFIAEAVQRWNKHTEDFETKDAAHAAAIQEALEKYQSAKDTMEKSKEAVSASDIVATDLAEPSEEELMADVTPSIQDDMRSMVRTFDEIRARQEEIIDGSVPKKARIDQGDGASGDKPAFGARSLQPFGRGGK